MWTYRTCEGAGGGGGGGGWGGGGGGAVRAHIDGKSLITKLFTIALISSTPSLRLHRI